MLRRETLPLIKSTNLHCFGSRAERSSSGIWCDDIAAFRALSMAATREVCKSAAIQITLRGLKKMIQIQPAELETWKAQFEAAKFPSGRNL